MGRTVRVPQDAPFPEHMDSRFRGNDVISAIRVAFTLAVIPRHPRENGEKAGIHCLIQDILEFRNLSPDAGRSA